MTMQSEERSAALEALGPVLSGWIALNRGRVFTAEEAGRRMAIESTLLNLGAELVRLSAANLRLQSALAADPTDQSSEIERLRSELSKCAWHSAIEEASEDAAALARERDELRAKIDRLRADKDEAYRQRNLLVRALASIFRSGVRRTEIEGWDPEWQGCVYLDLPTGQASYHYHHREAALFSDLPPYTREYDGHSKEDAETRILGAAKILQTVLAHDRASRRALAERAWWLGWDLRGEVHGYPCPAAPGDSKLDAQRAIDLDALLGDDQRIDWTGVNDHA